MGSHNYLVFAVGLQGGRLDKLLDSCDLVINQVLGNWAVDSSLQNYTAFCIRRVERFYELGLKAPDGFQWLHQTPRADNSKADALANHALHVGVFHRSHVAQWQVFLEALASKPMLRAFVNRQLAITTIGLYNDKNLDAGALQHLLVELFSSA